MASFQKKKTKSFIKQRKTAKNVLNLILRALVVRRRPSGKEQRTKLDRLTVRDLREGVKIILKFLFLNRRRL